MQTRAMSTVDPEQWDEEDDDFEIDRVATAEADFEQGAALHGLWICVRSQELRSGRVTAVFSGVTVDLREALPCPEGATLHFQAAVSGIHVLVPPGWEVFCDVDAICSGVSDNRRTSRAGTPRPRLRITGSVVAVGLSVR